MLAYPDFYVACDPDVKYAALAGHDVDVIGIGHYMSVVQSRCGCLCRISQ